MTSLTSPPKTLGSSPAANQNSPSKAPVTQPPIKSPDKFELTTDYIQQTIQQALKKDNLSPEIEQKLLALQQHNQEHDPPLVKKGKVIDPTTGEPMDDEWDGASSAERSIAQKNRRKKVEESVIAERIAANSVATPVSRRTPSQMAAARAGNRGQPPKAPPISSTTPPSGQTTQVSEMTEEKKKQILQSEHQLQRILISTTL